MQPFGRALGARNTHICECARKVAEKRKKVTEE